MHDPQYPGVAVLMVENIVRQMAFELETVAGHQACRVAIDLQRQFTLHNKASLLTLADQHLVRTYAWRNMDNHKLHVVIA